MNIYFAARFSRLQELKDYKTQIEQDGDWLGEQITVTSRWLLGGHEWVGTPDEDIPVEHNAKFAQEDLDDINLSEVVVCFTEPAKSGPARGGRHVEMGYALARNKRVLCVGHRENVFYCLPQVEYVETWADARRWLLGRATERPHLVEQILSLQAIANHQYERAEALEARVAAMEQERRAA